MSYFRHVANGEPLAIGAGDWNGAMDAALAHRNATASQTQYDRTMARNTVVFVTNNSGVDVDQFGILGIGDPTFLPGDALGGFKGSLAISGDLPVVATHGGRFVVTLGPIAKGKTGHAIMAGVVQVQINVGDVLHTRATVSAGGVMSLVSSATGGGAEILYAAGTGVCWCIIRLGGVGAGNVQFGTPTVAYTTGATITLVPCDVAGTANGMADVTVQAGWTLPANTNIPTTAIIPYMMAANGSYYPIGVPREVVTNIQYDTTTHKLEKKVRYDFGAFASTESSAWVEITTAVDCTAV